MRRKGALRWAGAVLLALVPLACGGSFDSGEQVSFDTWDGDPDWSPDGRLIAFSSSRGPGGIYVLTPGGKALRLVFPGNASDPDWSPDGDRIAFSREDGLYVMRSDGQQPRRVLRGKRFSLPAWTPDGSELAFVRAEPDFSTSIHIVRLDGRGSRRLLPAYRGSIGPAQPGSIGAMSETEPAWSPDGRSIAFQAGEQIVIASVADGTRRSIAEPGTYEPAWSPDGRLIAFQCAGSLCVANADGTGETRRLAADGGDPSWAPDSRRIVYEHYLYGGSGYSSDPQSLSVVDAVDGGIQKLTFGLSLPQRG